MNIANWSTTLVIRVRALLVPLAVTASMSVSAGLVSENSIYGPDTLTLDTSTNLEWLDLTLSTNLSINQVNARLGPGQQFDGFRYATNAEITTLFMDGGLTPPVFFSTLVSDVINVDNLISLLGRTFTDPPLYGTLGFESDTTGFAGPDHAYVPWLYIQTTCPPSGCAVAVAAGVAYQVGGLPALDLQRPDTGSYLVRSSASTVPEPATLALVGLGLAGLGFSRRKQ